MEPSARCVSVAPPARDRPRVVLAGPRGGPPADSQPLARGAQGRAGSFHLDLFQGAQMGAGRQTNRDHLPPGTVPILVSLEGCSSRTCGLHPRQGHARDGCLRPAFSGLPARPSRPLPLAFGREDTSGSIRFFMP